MIVDNFIYSRVVYNKKIYKIINKKNCYNVHGFSYVNLIKLYKSLFDSVYVEKYENFNQFNVFKKIFNLNNEDICDL